MLFLLVGYDTTASTINSACHLLATNTEKQEKLFEEITTVLDELRNECDDTEIDPIQLVTFDALNRFKYLDAVVKETLRIYPAQSSTERKASKILFCQQMMAGFESM